jgi:hypothetical protein
MIKQWINVRAASATAVAASLVLAGTIASAQAAPSRTPDSSSLTGYTKDQCKNGGWRTFKNADGSQMFRNQGQCVAYFVTGQNPPPVSHHQNLFAALVGFFVAIFAWFGGLFGSLAGLFGNFV